MDGESPNGDPLGRQPQEKENEDSSVTCAVQEGFVSRSVSRKRTKTTQVPSCPKRSPPPTKINNKVNGKKKAISFVVHSGDGAAGPRLFP